MSATPSRHRPRRARLAPWLVMWAALACVPVARAVDAEASWASLSGEQQYILSGFASRWAKLDVAARRKLLARADVEMMKSHPRSSPATAAGDEPDQAGDKDKAKVEAAEQLARGTERATAYKTSRKRHGLSATEARLPAHSLRLRRALRDLPGLSFAERRLVLERWGGMTAPQRLLMVDRYMHNIDDDDEVRLQAELRDGTISKSDLAKGLANGQLDDSDVQDVMGRGSMASGSTMGAVASPDTEGDADGIEPAVRDGDAETNESAHVDAPDDAADASLPSLVHSSPAAAPAAPDD